MPFITFTTTQITQEATPKRFEAGKTYDLRSDSCRRWKMRDVARNATPEEIAALRPPRAIPAAAVQHIEPRVVQPAPVEPVVFAPPPADLPSPSGDAFDQMDRAALFDFIKNNGGTAFRGAGTDALRQKARDLAKPVADDAE